MLNNSKILLKIYDDNVENISIGCLWKNNKETDIDIILILMNSESELDQNRIVEIIYYEKTKTLNGSCYHFGDDETGINKKHEKHNEMVYIDLNKIDINIDSIAVILNEYNGINLDEIEDLQCKIYYGKPDNIDEVISVFDIKNFEDFNEKTAIIGYFDKNKTELEWSFESKNKEMAAHQIDSIKKCFEHTNNENIHKDSIIDKIKNLFS